ncbi:hypothetical protein H7X46_23355 [Pseudonocardia sp. C8]|uniref:Uncharacterized protein n=1 Tax=Saccharopolyspora cebuensis TaxID=418759 RepID=A0ABV4CN22_9PSEU|nr:hypothetical protein [Pseudonocardia sp. C8]MBC3193997.1 hypothetical protein [Pseudonocardia sp. C8]
MSVAELRTELTSLAAQLPVSPLSTARRSTEDARASLASAWRGSDHRSAQAAVTAASAATERLARIIAALEQAAEEIAAYNECL